ncbi:cilia- and flagella-associated protein 221 [Aulostomus maculatus]
MEVSPSSPQILSNPLRRGTPLPLSQLVEDSMSRSYVPNHLLESKIYAKVQRNTLIHVEPSALHFSGFELGKDYLKSLKLINISAEVMDIHIIPTQTKYFQTTYTKKYRLIPGLAYTVKIQFCADEWRYYYDCLRVHCKGEENLLIPVHAYPVIDDLHIPAHIDLPVVPLGESVSRAIPLRCSCPIDFEFQVYVIEPHEAFSIHPLSGVVPANGQVRIIVTFTPFLYETCQVTIQLVISQFNTKPYLCTITGSSAPHLALSPPQPCSSTGRDQTGLRPGLKPPVDIGTPAWVAKMLIADTNKISFKHLKEVKSCGSMVALKDRQMKEALFLKKVQQHVKEEQANHLRCENATCLDLHHAKLTDFLAPKGVPSFQFDSSFQLELKQRALRLFQQAARKVVIRCRMKRRLTSMKKLSDNMKSSPLAQKDEEKTHDLKIFPSSFTILSEESGLLTPRSPVPVPVEPIHVTVTTLIPVFKLQVPQHYKLMGYRPVSAWEAWTAYIHPTSGQPLRSLREEEEPNEGEDKGEEQAGVHLAFTMPEALLRPVEAHPLRVFNPAPGLHTHKPTAKYLESDLEFHLCPLPRYPTSEIHSSGFKTQTAHTQRKFLDRKELIKGVMTWKNFSSITSNCLSKLAGLSSDVGQRRCIDYSTDILPLTTPAAVTAPPDDLAAPIGQQCDGAGVQLTPQMIRAEFLSRESLVTNSNRATGETGRHQRMEATLTSQFNQMGRRVMGRLKLLGVTAGASHSSDRK